eukprot:80454_1
MGGDCSCEGIGYDKCIEDKWIINQYDSPQSINCCGWCIDYNNITNNSLCIDQLSYCRNKSLCKQYEWPPKTDDCQESFNTAIVFAIGCGACVGSLLVLFAFQTLQKCQPKRAQKLSSALIAIISCLLCIYIMIVTVRASALYFSSQSEDAEKLMNWSWLSILLVPLLIVIIIWIVDVFTGLFTRIKLVFKASDNDRKRNCLSLLIFVILLALCMLIVLYIMNLTPIDLKTSLSLASILCLIIDLASLAGELDTQLSPRNIRIKLQFICCSVGNINDIINLNGNVIQSNEAISEKKKYPEVISSNEESKSMGLNIHNESVISKEHSLQSNARLPLLSNHLALTEQERRIRWNIWILFVITIVVVGLIVFALYFEDMEPCILNVATFILFLVDAIWWLQHKEYTRNCGAVTCSLLFGLAILILSLYSCIIGIQDESQNWHRFISLMPLIFVAFRKLIKCEC